MPQVFHPSQAQRSPQWVTLMGPDAADFLHRLTTVHIRDLEPGQGAPGLFLTAQGKIRASFRVWRYGGEEFGFETERDQSGVGHASLLSTIDLFTFAEKMQLADVTELQCSWIFLDPQSPPPAPFQLLKPGTTIATADGVRLCHQGERDWGRPWITAWGRKEQLHSWIEKQLSDFGRNLSETELETWRIDALAPRAGFEIEENSNPLELGMAAAIAPQKGCYPGQEVIERTVSLGSPAQRLCRIEGNGTPPAVGAPLWNSATPPAEIGRVTSSCSRGNHFKALALVKKIAAKENTELFLRPENSEAVGVRIAQVSIYA